MNRQMFQGPQSWALGLEALDPEFAAIQGEDGEASGASCPTFTPVAVENPGGGRVKDKRVPAKSDLVFIRGAFGAKVPLHRVTATAHQALVCAARADGIKAPFLLPTGSRSGFRDPKQQEEAWKKALDKYKSEKEARKWVAKPGSSAHQSGRAIDFYMGKSNSSGNVASLRKTQAYNWMVANAKRFGFYPYTAEPWHWEYNPPAASSGELLSEFFGPQIAKGFGSGFSGMGFRRRHPRTYRELEESEFNPTTINYTVDPSQPYGPKWKANRPPGLPASARQASTRGGATPFIEMVAQPLFLGEVFVKTIKHLSQTESGARFALPANIFDARPKEQRPAGKGLITAWGAFQFNRDAWRALSGVSKTAFPWECTPYEELLRPIVRYAQLFLEVLKAGGSNIAAARGIRLWHRTPAGYRTYVRNGSRGSFESAWQQVPAEHRTITDRHLREAGILSEAEAEWSWGSISNWFRPSQPAAPATSTSTTTVPSTSAIPSPLALSVRLNGVALAMQEWKRWNYGKTKESDSKIRPVLEDYWRTGVGYKPSQTSWWSAVPWSAAFISWIMKKAGAGKDFKYSAGHSYYTVAAKENAQKNNSNMFKAYKSSQLAPRLGDIVCNARAGSGATYDNIRGGMTTHCDIVTSVQPGSLKVIGGNVDNSVSQKTVPIDANGRITKPGYFAVIRIGN